MCDHCPGASGSANRVNYRETAILPPFGLVTTRAPIRVLRSPRRLEQLTADAATNQPETYSPNGPPLTPEAQLPQTFDWHAYLQYHPELVAAGIGTQEQAEQHYRRYGSREGRLYRRQRIIIRYTAGTGLINQHYCHINAFALAAALGAEIVLPPAAKRDSFGLYFSTVPKDNQVSWAPASLDHILDVATITKRWQAKGMAVHKVRCMHVSMQNCCSNMEWSEWSG